MLEYSNDNISEVRADALVVEVNCLGDFSERALRLFQNAFPENYQAYMQAFHRGDIEPGRLLLVDRGAGKKPRYLFNFPTRIHPRGETKAEYIEAGVDELVRHVLNAGIKSLAVPRFENPRGLEWYAVKQRILASFARVPEISLLILSPPGARTTPKQVAIYSDGGAAPNPGVGGYGVVLRFGGSQKEICAGFERTTNQRMELLAAIVGLESLKEPCRVRLHSDSRYVVDIVNNGLLFRLQANEWKARKMNNVDLWKRFYAAYLRHEVELVWVKGHAGIADNERCDQLATRALNNGDRQIDQGYLDQLKNKQELKAANKSVSPRAAAASDLKPNCSSSRKPKKIGDPCRHCQSPLTRREPKKKRPGSKYYYAWYLYCENCKRIYHVEEAKVYR